MVTQPLEEYPKGRERKESKTTLAISLTISGLGGNSSRQCHAEGKFILLFWRHFFPLKRDTIPDTFFSISTACANEESSVF